MNIRVQRIINLFWYLIIGLLNIINIIIDFSIIVFVFVGSVLITSIEYPIRLILMIPIYILNGNNTMIGDNIIVAKFIDWSFNHAVLFDDFCLMIKEKIKNKIAFKKDNNIY